MEAALDAFARRIGVAIDEERERTTETARFPFDVRRRRMSVVRDGTVMVKGATDAVFPRCLVPPGATESLQEMAGRGLRVLAIAARPVDGIPSTVDDAETDLRCSDSSGSRTRLGRTPPRRSLRAGARASGSRWSPVITR